MRLTQILILTLAAFLATACDYMNPNAPSPSGPGTAGTAPANDPSAATYQNVAARILRPRCYSCHTGEEKPNLGSWATFAQDTRYVIAGNPSQSAIYLQVATGRMPRDEAQLGASDLQLLADWITAGALNN